MVCVRTFEHSLACLFTFAYKWGRLYTLSHTHTQRQVWFSNSNIHFLSLSEHTQQKKRKKNYWNNFLVSHLEWRKRFFTQYTNYVIVYDGERERERMRTFLCLIPFRIFSCSFSPKCRLLFPPPHHHHRRRRHSATLKKHILCVYSNLHTYQHWNIANIVK